MIKVALIGCGTMGKTHSSGYMKIKDAKVVAFCDIDEEKAQTLAQLHNSEVYTDFKAMMKQADFDVLDICLPTYLHKDYAIPAMKAGKHVFCEKPIALCVEDAQEMVQTAKECNVKFSVGHVLRFFPAYKNAIEQVEKGKIGTPRLIRTTRNQAFPQWSWEGWYKDYNKSGGPIVDLIIHDIDWVLHNFGKVDRVFAKSYQRAKELEQDHCIVVLHLENGTIAHIEGSWAYPRGSAFRMTFEIVGTQGQIEFDNIASASLIKQTAPNNQHEIAYLSPVLDEYEPYCAELNEFIKCVKNNVQPKVTGEQAIEVLRVVLAAVKSSKTGEPVSL